MNLSSRRGSFACATGAALYLYVLASAFRPGVAGAAESAAKAGEPATRFASVSRIRGEVTATVGDSGLARTLRENDVVFVGERIRAAPSAEAVLKTDDAGLIAIRPRAEFVTERFAAEGKPTDHFALHLIVGGLRLITGWIGRINRAQYRVSTSTATIGVRGTDHEPYEISVDLAKTFSQLEGTYDKVNRGGTTMDVDGKNLDIDPGRVGFARSVRGRPRTRSIMTLVLPVLLDVVPDFYVPGQFDDELDRFSRTADENALRELNVRRNALLEQAPAGAPGSAAPDSSSVSSAQVVGECAPNAIARTWLTEFDAAIARRDAPVIIDMFAPEVLVRVTVRGASGESRTVEMGRDELARSTIAAVAGLTDYQQRRPSIESRAAGGGTARCDRISVRSVVIEQGRQNGKPYRFESVEEYVLERRAGSWLAIRVETTQQ
jgi:hypothetical protein